MNTQLMIKFCKKMGKKPEIAPIKWRKWQKNGGKVQDSPNQMEKMAKKMGEKPEIAPIKWRKWRKKWGKSSG